MRPAFASDAEAVASLYSEAGRAMTARDAVHEIDAANVPSRWLLIAEIEGSVVALGSFTIVDETAELGTLVVTERRRRLGIAAALTGALEYEARARGAARVVVGPDANSDDGRLFYSQRGYKPAEGTLVLSFY